MLERKAQRLREVMHAAGRGKAVIGLSGGIDSAVAMALAARALGPEHVVAVRIPSRHTEQVHIDDAEASARRGRAARGEPADGAHRPDDRGARERCARRCPQSAIREGNASARARMIVIYDLAQELHALVVGTENRTENLLGYFTRFGDAASDIEPITDLYKTEVRAAARVLGQPQAVLDKHPTAGLWGGQTDEDELGFTYHDADRALVAMFDLGDDARGGGGAHRASTSTWCGGCARVPTASRGSTRCPTAWGREKRGQSPSGTVPRTPSGWPRFRGARPLKFRPRAAAACRPTRRARAAPRPRAGARARG